MVDVVETEQKKEIEQEQKKETERVDIDKVKTEAKQEFLKSIGVEDEGLLKDILLKSKDEQDKNKTDVEKLQELLQEATRQLVTEKDTRVVAEAKVSAIKLGAKPELVEDLVVIAKSRVTKEKDVNSVIAEIKAGTSGSVYFGENEVVADTVTRSRVTKPKEKQKQNDDKNSGTMAERLLANRKEKKNFYYK